MTTHTNTDMMQVPETERRSLLRSLTTVRISRIVIALFALLALFYSGNYLLSLSSNIHKLPVALVNSDTGVQTADGTLNAGKEVLAGLEGNDQINWTLTNHEDATNGVRDGRYYFALEIPQDFSQAVASPTSSTPHQAQLNATYNDANGYFSSVIGSTVMQEVLGVVNDSIGSEAVSKLLIGINSAGEGLGAAAQGATQLGDGTDSLHQGMAKAKDGTGKLYDNTQRLEVGVNKLGEGSQKLAAGTSTLNSQLSGIAQPLQNTLAQLEGLHLTEALNTSGQASQALNSEISAMTSMLNSATQEQARTAAQLHESAQQVRALGIPLLPEQLEALASTLLSTGVGPQSPLSIQANTVATLSTTVNSQLNDDSSALRTGANLIDGGALDKVTQLINGVQQLDSGAHTLNTGLDSLGEKMGNLNTAVGKLDNGNAQLLEGSVKLNTGAHTLAEALNTGAQQIPSLSDTQIVKATDVISQPVDLHSNNSASLSSPGTAIAPFFFWLALFVAGIILFIMLPPLNLRALRDGNSALITASRSLIKPAVITTVISLIALALITILMGFTPASALGLVGIFLLSGLVIMMMNQALIAFFGPSTGKVISVGLLVLMLLTSGGLFPIQTQNSLFQALHTVNPMTYSVNAIREVMYGFSDGRFGTAIAVLLTTALVSFGLTVWAAYRFKAENNTEESTATLATSTE